MSYGLNKCAQVFKKKYITVLNLCLPWISLPIPVTSVKFSNFFICLLFFFFFLQKSAVISALVIEACVFPFEGPCSFFFHFNGKRREIPQKWVNALRKIMKNKKIILEGSNKPNKTPRKERFLCQINNKKKKKNPVMLGLFARGVDDLFTAGTNVYRPRIGCIKYKHEY